MAHMTLRQDSQALSAYRQMLRELGVDVDRLSDASVIDALQRASASWMKVEEDVGQFAAQVRETCRDAGARVHAAFSLRRTRRDDG